MIKTFNLSPVSSTKRTGGLCKAVNFAASVKGETVQALGGRFRSVLPSDLFAPGAMAVESIPSPGAQYANEVSRGELARLFRRSAASLFSLKWTLPRLIEYGDNVAFHFCEEVS